MKLMTVAAALAALCLGSSLVQADEVKSGLQEGEFVGAFYVTKCAGAEDDNVDVGDNLCYRCKNGGRPQVMVFTRSDSKNVTELLSKLDAELGKNADKELKAFVNYLSDNKAAASESAKKLAAATKAKHIPFVVPNEYENGPDNYGINPKAAVTIIMASGGQVKANHAFASGDEVDVNAVVTDLAKILK